MQTNSDKKQTTQEHIVSLGNSTKSVWPEQPEQIMYFSLSLYLKQV